MTYLLLMHPNHNLPYVCSNVSWQYINMVLNGYQVRHSGTLDQMQAIEREILDQRCQPFIAHLN